MKALVICGDSIGDTVFSTPVIRALKVQLEDVEVHGLFSASSVFLMDENPYIDKIHQLDASFWKTWRMLNEENFGLIVNLRTDFRAAILVLLLRTRSYSLQSNFWQYWLMINLKINHLRNVHQVDRMIKVVEPLGIKGDELGLDLFLPEHEKVLLDWLPEAFQKGFVVFSLSAPYATRKLPLNKTIELCDKINRPIVLLGTHEDAEQGKIISRFFAKGLSADQEEGLASLNKKTIVFNACGKFSFNQMASVVKQARAVFTFDNDFIPVASAFRKEIFGLWGNTILLFGRYPYRTKFTVLETNNVSCRPCSSHGFEKCPKRHFRCMNDITFDFYLP
ncbi:MAG: glycosyl transferase [Cyclobacteriaceae bacterium]|nr:glycosyl transferase [Cyclobacteriaceae bacterium]MDH4297952.1 glycosyl transferase [Cyclobacteriaceae bacterium]MDH5250676.1 glycosyl transferase [Cyclobacteriaceae bacterium]